MTRARGVRRVEARALDRGEDGLELAADDGAHAGRLERGRASHAAGPVADEPDGAGVVEHARDRGRGELAHRVAGRDVDDLLSGTPVEQRAERDEGRTDDEGLGDGRVPDRVGVGLGPVPDEVDAGRLGERGERLGRAGELEPRAQEAGGLGALTRAHDG